MSTDGRARFSLAFSGRRVLVTGASGYIAPTVCRRLVALGADVFAVSRRQPAENASGSRWLGADLCDEAAVRELVESVKPEYVFHLAGLAVGKRGKEHVLATLYSNLATTAHLMTAVCDRPELRRFVLASSLEEPQAERTETIPSSPYAASKWAASGYARMFHALYGFPVVLARIFMTYGPGRQDPGKLIPYAIRSLLSGETLELSSGSRQIDWIYIDDVADGLIAAACAPGMEGETVDIGSGRLVSIRELIETLAALVDPGVKPHFGAQADRPYEQVRAADIARTAHHLSWKPSVSLEEGLRRTVDWYGRRAHPRCA